MTIHSCSDTFFPPIFGFQRLHFRPSISTFPGIAVSSIPGLNGHPPPASIVLFKNRKLHDARRSVPLFILEFSLLSVLVAVVAAAGTTGASLSIRGEFIALYWEN